MKYLKFILLISLISCSQHTVVEHQSSEREPANFQTCFESLNQIIKQAKSPSIVSIKKSFNEVNSIEELEALYGNRSFIDIQHEATQEQVHAYNKKFYELLNQPLSKAGAYDKASYITNDEANIIYKDIETAKVNVDNACYDPKGTVGFCFGRATMVHMEAIIRSVDPDSVKKIWITGDMGVWGHHVATLVKAQEGWYVIDVEVGKVVRVQEWFNFFKKTYQPKDAKEIMLFVSPAERFGPHSATGYSSRDLFNTATNEFNRDGDFYRGFFHDYFDELDKRKKTVKKFPAR
jgi:hypothetical protein